MYRKFTAAHIFTGTQLLPAENVLVTEDDGTIIEIVNSEDAGDDIENIQGMLCPGFINAHCHLELSHLKGLIPEHTGLVDFVFNIITQRQAETERIAVAIKNAEQEMIQNGIAAVGDICNTADTLQVKKEASILYHNFIEVTGFIPATAENRFEAALLTLQQFKKELAHLQNRVTLNPHAPYSVSSSLFALINQFPGNSLLTMHNQETEEENSLFISGTGDFLRLYRQLGIDISFFQPTGKTSLQTILPYLNKQQSLILVHDVTTSEDDIRSAQQAVTGNQLSNIFFCLCPNANRYISNGLPDVNRLLKTGCDIILGTDSLASNHQLSILEEMKTIQQHFPSVSVSQLLQWGTSNGARALQMEGLGNFEKGKKPGIVQITGTNGISFTKQSEAKRLL